MSWNGAPDAGETVGSSEILPPVWARAVPGAVFLASALGLAGWAVRLGATGAPTAEPPLAIVAGFVLAGAGLYFAAARRPIPATVLGTLAAASGPAFLIEHSLLGGEWTLRHAPCAVTKALCLVLIGAAIGLLRLETPRFKSAVPSGFLGAVTAALSLGELAGRVIEKLLVGVASSSALAVWTFGGLAVLGAGTVAQASRESGLELRARAPRWLAMAVTAFLAAGAMGLWQSTRITEEYRLENLVSREVDVVASRIVELERDEFAGVLGESAAHGFSGAVLDGRVLLAGDAAAGGPIAERWGREKAVSVADGTLTARIWPAPELVREELTALPGLTLAVSVAIACLVGFSIDRSGTARYRERKFRAFVEAAPHAWVTVDGEGVIVQVNSRAQELFGYRRDELLGRTVEVLVPERYQTIHPEYRRGYAREPRPRPMGEGRILYARCKDGSDLPVEISLSPVATDEGLLVLTAIVDVSRRIELARTLTSMNEKLEQQVAERTAALERRAHELERANAELERFNRLAVGREHRMIALKREVNEMAMRFAQEPKYDLSFLSEE